MDELVFLQTMLHYKAQHLAALNNSFLPLLEDDSQSNLGWNMKRESFISRDLPNGSYLELSCKSFTFIYHGKGFKADLPIAGRKDIDIELWIKEQLVRDGLDASMFPAKLNYKLSHFEVQIDKWNTKLKGAAKQLSAWRTFAQNGGGKLGEFYSHHSELRIWPHHFDTGMLVDLGDAYTKGVGIGYAIKDAVCSSPYYYAYAWGNNTLNHDAMKPLTCGLWKNGDWKGAILPASIELREEDVFQFYLEATNTFVENI